MKLLQTFRSAGLAGVVLLAASGAAVAGIQVGEPAPAFTAQSAAGTPVTLEALRGRYVVLEWTNPSCPFVKKHYRSGNMQGLQKAYTAKDVAWLTVFSSAPGKHGHVDGDGARAFRDEMEAAPTAMLLDGAGNLGRLYNAQTTPDMVVIDPEGRLIYTGAIDDRPSADIEDVEGAKNYVRAALDEAMAGKPVTTPVSKPYGCAVKY